MVPSLTTFPEFTPGVFGALFAVSAVLMIISVFAYLYLFQRRYVFIRTLATSKSCNDILTTLKNEFSGRYRIPWTHLTQFQVAKAPYSIPAVSLKYDVIKVSAHDNRDDFFHAALTTRFIDLAREQMRAGPVVNLAIVLLPFGATHYSRPVRRLIHEIEKLGVPTTCMIDRNTPGYEFPYTCEPRRNSYLDHHDSYLSVEFLTEALCMQLAAKEKEQDTSSINLNQKLLLEYAALRSNPVLNQRGNNEHNQSLTLHLRFHFVGYSLGAMRISRILADGDMDKALADIVQRVGDRYPFIKLSTVIASASCGYATFDVQAPLNHPKYVQRMLAKHLIQEFKENAEKRAYLIKHLAEKVDDPTEVLERAMNSGLLSDLDAHLSCALYEFENYADYYKELLPTGKIRLFQPTVPVLFLNTLDDFITGKNIYVDELEEHPHAVAIVLNKGGHLGTLLHSGEDVSSKIIARWIDMHR
ncbi:Hypothetical protein GLP15_2914 [Giardia lamblia P15]|uniref:Uncharacterized protein n=1 Tax=Giardia intestinalis (strain P15) TaxID=658858 RepID=E1EZK9_GIAIA|nr:Hypothetical protein GLP15_2914 [Giardia lamblia P15]